MGSKRLKLVLVIITALGLGVLGRALGDGNLENSFLADVMPWMRGTSVTLYFGEPSGRHIVPVTRKLSGDQESPGGLVDALLGGPAEGTILLNDVPDGTTALSASVEGSTFRVNLSGSYLEGRSPLLDEAVVQTLMSWPGVDDVQIAVEGDVLTLTGSNGHLAYFFDRERDMLVATPIGGRTHREVMAAYLRGPEDPGLVGMPADVQVVSLQSAPGSGLLVVDLTYTDSLREFAIDDGKAMRRVLEGLMATLTTGFPDTQFIYVDFEGHGTLGLGQCANLLRRTQPPPEILNDERLIGGGSVT